MTRRRHHRDANRWIQACITAHNVALPYEGRDIVREFVEEEAARTAGIEREDRLRAQEAGAAVSAPAQAPPAADNAQETTEEGKTFRDLLRDRLIAFEDSIGMRVGANNGNNGVPRMPRGWMDGRDD